MQTILKNQVTKFSKRRISKGLINLFLNLLREQNNIFNSACDIGCGRGFWSYVGLDSGLIKKVVGCDIFSAYQVDELNKMGQAVYRGVKSPPYLPFKDNDFDLVFSMDVIEHEENDLVFLSEHIRICKHHGFVLICTPNKYRPMNLIRYGAGNLKYPRKLSDAYFGECIHVREYSKNDLEKLLSNFSKSVEYKLIPYWLGIGQIGFAFSPRRFKALCHYWVCLIRKK